ncbi:MAG: cupin domain-containing protein [Spirosomataceae bacterium]
MANEVILQISSKLKDYRKSKGITIQQLADRAQVSKGLISQIENNRTIPSLLVLINLIRSLGVDLNDFFADVEQASESKVVVKRNDEYQAFEKEHSKGFSYKRILTRTVQNTPTDIVLLELAPKATRAFMVKTNAFEYKYIIKGQVEYIVGDQKYDLSAGDSIFFDANLPHKPANVGEETALMLVMYFFKE